MDNQTKKHLQDILDAITEVNGYFEDTPKRFDEFFRDIRLRRAIERDVEIMGEAEDIYKNPNAK